MRHNDKSSYYRSDEIYFISHGYWLYPEISCISITDWSLRSSHCLIPANYTCEGFYIYYHIGDTYHLVLCLKHSCKYSCEWQPPIKTCIVCYISCHHSLPLSGPLENVLYVLLFFFVTLVISRRKKKKKKNNSYAWIFLLSVCMLWFM